MIEIIPLREVGEVKPGSDLAATLAAALSAARLAVLPSDVLVVTQKIVSKAEDRFVALTTIEPGAEARELATTTLKDPRLVELILRESTAVVRATKGVIITRHRLGFVMANAGVDRSNLGPGRQGYALLLPVDPDASARRLAEALRAGLGASPAVVISDSFGRPWRLGVVNIAIGAHGLPSLIDRRGELDRDGRALEVTQVAYADLIAAAAGLAAGEAAESIPAVLIRGCAVNAPALPATALVRPFAEDLFR